MLPQASSSAYFLPCQRSLARGWFGTLSACSVNLSDWPSDPLSLPFLEGDVLNFHCKPPTSDDPVPLRVRPSEPQMPLPLPCACHASPFYHPFVLALSVPRVENNVGMWRMKGREESEQSGYWLRMRNLEPDQVGHPPPYFSLCDLKVRSGHFFTCKRKIRTHVQKAGRWLHGTVHNSCLKSICLEISIQNAIVLRGAPLGGLGQSCFRRPLLPYKNVKNDILWLC